MLVTLVSIVLGGYAVCHFLQNCERSTRGISAHVCDSTWDWSTCLFFLDLQVVVFWVVTQRFWGERCVTSPKTASKETILDVGTAFFTVSILSTPSYFCGNIKCFAKHNLYENSRILAPKGTHDYYYQRISPYSILNW